MVQKSKKPPVTKIDDPVAPKRRGRPRAYQPDVALGKALDLFRKDGFAATSLDDLSAATGMNRPSLYGAFGDKRELFIKSYRRYRDDARARDGRHLPRRAADPPAAGADLCGGARHLSVRRIRSARLLHGDDRGLRGGARSRYPRHGAGRLCRTRQGFCGLFPAAPRRRANCPRAPIRSYWPNSPPPPFTPSRSVPAPGRRARNWRRSSRARSM